MHMFSAAMIFSVSKAFFLLTTIEIVRGAKILLASPQLGSHVLEQITLGEELVSRGHEVYMALGSPFQKFADVEKRGIKTLQYKFPDNVLFGISDDFDRLVVDIAFAKVPDKMTYTYKYAAELGYRDCGYMMNDGEFLEKVRDISFDLAILEAFVPAPCVPILPKSFGIPFVTMALFFMPWQHRFPALPSFVPVMLPWTSSADVNFLSRLKNLLIYIKGSATFNELAPPDLTLLKQFAPGLNNWDDLLNESELFMSFTDYFLGNTIPQMPNYISTAGLSTKNAKKLPNDLEKIVERAKEGIIVLSFGSSVSFFPTKVIHKYLDVFENLNQTVIIKLHIPDGVTVPKNVIAMKWLPQNDLLGHPKTRLFITHCGIGGLHEALFHAVPMIGFPLFAEQHLNCQRMSNFGYGKVMNVQEFTTEELLNNIQEVFNNSRYRSTIQKASAMFRDQPLHPLQRAVFWTEHVIKYGGKHLRSFAMDMPLYEFLMLDILIMFVLAAVVVLVAGLLFVKYTLKMTLILSSRVNSSKQKLN